MSTIALRKIVAIDSNHMLHIQLPSDMVGEYEVIVLSKSDKENRLRTNEKLSEEQWSLLKLQSETGFAKNVLLDPAEDVWNEI